MLGMNNFATIINITLGSDTALSTWKKGKYFKPPLWYSEVLGRIMSPDKNALKMSLRVWKYVSMITFHSLLSEHIQLQIQQWSTISKVDQKVLHSFSSQMERSFSDWTNSFSHKPLFSWNCVQKKSMEESDLRPPASLFLIKRWVKRLHFDLKPYIAEYRLFRHHRTEDLGAQSSLGPVMPSIDILPFGASSTVLWSNLLAWQC